LKSTGALFSVGDGHAAQGDGEVCVSAVETSMTSTLRLTVRKDLSLRAPQFRIAGPLLPRTNTGARYATTGVGPDLLEAARDAVRSMLDYLVATYALSRPEAYALCSVAIDLKISEAVSPNYVVSAFIPLSIFTSA
jgi:acetamidase/formamidase